MALIDLDSLLKDLSPEAPCGENLSYDVAYLNLETVAQGTPERQVGEAVIPAQEPNWKEVTAACVELFGRTRDLRVAMTLARSLLKQHGLGGLAAGLELLGGLLERHWEHVWPQLDPAEGNDPLERINILSGLGDAMFCQPVRQASLCSSRQLGRFSLRDVGIAKGEIVAAPDPSKPPAEMSVIEAAFNDTDTDELKGVAQAAKDCIARLGAIEAFVTDKVGAARAVSLDALRDSLRDVQACVEGYLLKRGAITQAGAAASQAGASGPSPAGEIRSVQDIVTAIDRICQYYERYEPSSPVPLMLRGARRMVARNFVEIMRQLPPESLRVLETLSGLGGETPAQA
jgi:type VI secretion system protein ImpA